MRNISYIMSINYISYTVSINYINLYLWIANDNSITLVASYRHK